MHLAEAVAILIARVFAMRVANRFVLVTPDRQARVDVILVCVDQAAWADTGLDDRLDGRLLHIGQHVQNHLTTTLDQPRMGGLSFSCVPRPGAPANLRQRPSRPFWRPRLAGPCARPRRKPRRSRPPRAVSRPAAWQAAHGAVAPSWPARRRHSDRAPRQSAGSRGSAP